MNKTTIDWPNLTHTINIGVGCKHGCPYCYARQLHNKRHKAYLEGAKLPAQYALPFNEYQYFPERLLDMIKGSNPKTVFIGSMCDQLGAWVPNGNIDDILLYCSKAPQHTYMMLTKNPVRYLEFNFPNNVMIGATITKQSDPGIKIMQHLSSRARPFLSLEPLLGSFDGVSFKGIELLIVGAMTGKNAVKPKKEWIDSIQHDNIHFKNNIKKYL